MHRNRRHNTARGWSLVSSAAMVAAPPIPMEQVPEKEAVSNDSVEEDVVRRIANISEKLARSGVMREPEEVAQQTSTKVITSIRNGKFDPRKIDNIDAYLGRCVRNTNKDLGKANKRRRDRESNTTDMSSPSGETPEFADGACPAPDGNSCKNEIIRIIRDSVHLLVNVNYRDAVQMYYLQELPYREIANIKNTTEVNVRAWVSRGLKELKRILEERYGENGCNGLC